MSSATATPEIRSWRQHLEYVAVCDRYAELVQKSHEAEQTEADRVGAAEAALNAAHAPRATASGGIADTG